MFVTLFFLCTVSSPLLHHFSLLSSFTLSSSSQYTTISSSSLLLLLHQFPLPVFSHPVFPFLLFPRPPPLLLLLIMFSSSSSSSYSFLPYLWLTRSCKVWSSCSFSSCFAPFLLFPRPSPLLLPPDRQFFFFLSSILLFFMASSFHHLHLICHQSNFILTFTVTFSSILIIIITIMFNLRLITCQIWH